jgi:hypothetical protein
MNDINQLTNSQLIKLHNEMKIKLRSEQTRLVNKQEFLESKITQNRLLSGQKKETSKVDSRALFAGNVNDINSIIWPFFFQSEMVEVGPNSNEVLNISITQEAPFSMVEMCKVVFYDDGGTWRYLNPKAYDNNVQAGNANGLKFSVVDSQSGRSWFEAPVSLDHIGDGKNPYKLPSPILVLPNANLEVQMFNSSSTTYRVCMMFKGYRVRVEDANNILSLVTE